MTHGRGSTTGDMQSIVPMLELKETVYLVPEGPYEIMPGRFAWYRHFWHENLELNLQEMDHSFSIIDECLELLHKKGFTDEQIVLFGHSQGGNLLLEYFMTKPRTFKAVIALRSCLIGKTIAGRPLAKNVPSVPVVLCGGRRDTFIPTQKIEQTAAVMETAGANVIRRKYEAAHGITRNELIEIRKMFAADFNVEKVRSD
jgi:predicted esterase